MRHCSRLFRSWRARAARPQIDREAVPRFLAGVCRPVSRCSSTLSAEWLSQCRAASHRSDSHPRGSESAPRQSQCRVGGNRFIFSRVPWQCQAALAAHTPNSWQSRLQSQTPRTSRFLASLGFVLALARALHAFTSWLCGRIGRWTPFISWRVECFRTSCSAQRTMHGWALRMQPHRLARRR